MSADTDFVVIDDDALTLELLCRRLRRADCTVECFTDTGDASRYLRAFDARVVLVDYRMPRVDGLDFLQDVLAENLVSQEHAYVCSATDLPEKARDVAQQLGVCALNKEIYRDVDRLLALID